MVKALPRVSVVVPVLNDAVQICSLLEALLGQSYPQDKFEIIVVDNGSIDGSRRAVEGFMARRPDIIRLLEEREIRGSYAARNAGIRNARGEIIAFTDSDCVPRVNWVEAGVKSLQERSASLGGGEILFTYRNNTPNIFEYFDSARKLNQKGYIEKNGFAATANLFAMKWVFEEYGLFRSELVSSGDLEFCRRAVDGGAQLIYIADAVVEHPARSTLKAIYKKSKRIAKGQKQMQTLGIVKPLRLEPGKLFSRGCPVNEKWPGRLSNVDKLQLIVLQNMLRWMNMLIRMV
jgi:glycosyltransferase involved in cell wall biosynthesis